MLDTTKPVDRTGNAFCGPLVVAAILGTSTGNVATEVANIRKRIGGAIIAHNGAPKLKRVRARTGEAVRGTYDSELFAVLAAHGVRTEYVDVGARLRPHRKLRGRPCYVNADGTRFHCGNGPPILSTEDWYPWTYLQSEALPLWRVMLRLQQGTYIVHLPRHWAVLSDGKWCETYTGGEWRDMRAVPGRNRKVNAAWRVRS